jgi:hypothetical protein
VVGPISTRVTDQGRNPGKPPRQCRGRCGWGSGLSSSRSHNWVGAPPHHRLGQPSVRQALGDVDQNFSDCAAFDGLMGGCCSCEREPVERQARVLAGLRVRYIAIDNPENRRVTCARVDDGPQGLDNPSGSSINPGSIGLARQEIHTSTACRHRALDTPSGDPDSRSGCGADRLLICGRAQCARGMTC